MNSLRGNAWLLLGGLLWVLAGRPAYAADYVYGAEFWFVAGRDTIHVLRLAPVVQGMPDAAASENLIWMSESGNVTPLNPIDRKLSSTMNSILQESKISQSIDLNTYKSISTYFNKNLSKLELDGNIRGTSLYIRRLQKDVTPNRDAYLWFLGRLKTPPDPVARVSLQDSSTNGDVPNFFQEARLAPHKDRFAAQWGQALASWKELLDPPKPKPHHPAEAVPDTTGGGAQKGEGSTGLLCFWPVAVGVVLALGLFAGFIWLALAMRRIGEKLEHLDDRGHRDSGTSVASLASELSSLTYRVDRMHKKMLEVDKTLEAFGRQFIAPPPDAEVIKDHVPELDKVHHRLAELQQDVTDLHQEVLKTQPIIADCVNEIKELKIKLESEGKNRSAWRFDLTKEWSKALEQRDRSFNQFWEGRLGKWQGLRELEGPALQAQLMEALPRLRETLQELRRREEELLAWYKKLRDTMRQSGGSLLRVEDLCLRNEATRQHNLQEMTKDYLPSLLRLDLREDGNPAEGLRHGMERLVEGLADPLESQADGIARELATLARRLYEALDEHAGKALVQIRAIAPVCTEQGITWITPPEGVNVDDKQHLVVDYRVGQGVTSTIAELLRPGYELKSGERLLDRVQAQIVVYR